MIRIRRAADRGRTSRPWLLSLHSFSFGGYYDRSEMGFRALRVINEDTVKPAKGFEDHAHQNMEIITYVLRGQLQHRDRMGNGSIITAGDVQRMSAGTGVTHSEFNHSAEEDVHFLQIWIEPDVIGLPPSYQQMNVPAQDKKGTLRLIASPERRDDTLCILHNVRVYAGTFTGDESVQHSFTARRQGYVQIARGSLLINDVALEAGDGARILDERSIRLSGGQDAELLLFDLP